MIAVAFSVIGEIWDYFDSSQRGAKRFLITSSDIHKQLGSISDYALHKSTYVGATENQPPYREYLYLVKGEKMKARVIIRVDSPTEGGEEHFSLVEIRPD